MIPKVIYVRPQKPSKLILKFNNDEIRELDVSRFWNSLFFNELKDWNYFRLVKIANGTVTWPNEQDIAPETIYIDSKLISAV